MTKKFRIWGLVQDRLSPVSAIHAQCISRGDDTLLETPVPKWLLSAKCKQPQRTSKRRRSRVLSGDLYLTART